MTHGLEDAPVFRDFGYSRYGDDRLREECGVFGVFGHPEAAALAALASRPAWSQTLLESIQAGRIAASAVPKDIARRLQSLPGEAIRRIARG